MRSRLTRSLGAAALVVASAIGVAACGDDAAPSAQVSATEHNDADVEFASDMLQHHAQALSMVDLTLGRPLDPEVQRLADGIRDAQVPEIETFTDWLTEWGEEVPATMRDHVNAGHDSHDLSESMAELDHGDMPGMLSAEDMERLQGSPDPEFQTLWLELMVEHHTGAVEMAEAHRSEGRYEPAVDLAGEIAESQSAEIERMRSLIGS